jgi:hypothetical protein
MLHKFPATTKRVLKANECQAAVSATAIPGQLRDIVCSESRDFPSESVLALYRAQRSSAADKPELLVKALRTSHSVVTASEGPTLVGIANAISAGYLVVYYPHLLVHPEYQARVGSD